MDTDATGGRRVGSLNVAPYSPNLILTNCISGLGRYTRKHEHAYKTRHSSGNRRTFKWHVGTRRVQSSTPTIRLWLRRGACAGSGRRTLGAAHHSRTATWSTAIFRPAPGIARHQP